jgi:hypothetical protein
LFLKLETILREANEDLARQIRHKQRKNSLKEVAEKMCAEGGAKVEELEGESEEKGGRGKGKGSILTESGNGDFRGGNSPSFRGGGICDCDGALKRGRGKVTLMLLSDVPKII